MLGFWLQKGAKMPAFIDLTGLKFERWLVVKETRKKQNHTYWLCMCDCGNEREVVGQHLRNGKSKSCGCFHKEITREIHKTHGMSKNDTYGIWKGMKARCKSKNSMSYASYGANGITVCEQWEEFENFLEDMGYRPGKEFSIDRIDVTKGYFKKNCKWSTRLEQARNRRTSKFIDTIEGKMTVSEAARRAGISQSGMTNRIIIGCPVEKLLNPKGWI